MKNLTVLMSLVALSAFSVPAAAADTANAGTAISDRTEYSFDDDVVVGDLVRPDEGDIVVRQRGKESSLITVRQNFVPELLKSVEDI